MALERLLTTVGTRCLTGPFVVSLHFAVAACYLMSLASFCSHVLHMFDYFVSVRFASSIALPGEMWIKSSLLSSSHCIFQGLAE